jgi:outer membrane protein TolC
VVGLTVPLPVYNRNQGNIAGATQAVDQTEAQLANQERQVILEIQRAFGDISRQYLEALIRHRHSRYRLNSAVGCRIFP